VFEQRDAAVFNAVLSNIAFVATTSWIADHNSSSQRMLFLLC